MVRRSTCIIIVATAAATALPALAQSSIDGRIAAGDARIDGGRVEPGEWTLRYIRSTDGEERQVGSVRYQVTRLVIDGESAVRVVQSITTPAGQFADTALFVQKTLRPISHRSHNPGRVLLLDFDGRRVTGSHTPATGEATKIDQDMGVDAIDANILDAAYGALPLAPGFEGTLAAYVYENGGPIDVGVRVIGRSQVEAEGHMRDAWELAVEYPFGTGRFWVDAETGQPVGAEITATDGSTTRVVR